MSHHRAPVIDPNSACWLNEAPAYEPSPALAGKEYADVAIIGGGFTGVSTAWHLAQRFPDRRIVLLEAVALANGASGRSGGQALNWINGVDPDDPALARRIYDVTCRGIDIIADLVVRYRLDAGFERAGCLEVYTTPQAAEAAHTRLERLAGAGVPLEWLPGSASGVAGAQGATRDPHAARVNGAALVRGLRPVLLAQGVTVYEQTPVTAVREGPLVELSTPAGEVHTRALVLATDAYTPALGYFRRGILPLHSHVVATAPLSSALWETLGWDRHVGFSDDRDRISYGCRTAGGRLVFGGGSNEAYTYLYGGRHTFPPNHRRAQPSFAAVEQRLRQYFPGAAGAPIAHRWTGTVGLTFDRVCSFGVRGEHRNVYYAVGYSGHGVALAMLAGRVLRDLYSDDHDPWRDLPFYQKPLPMIPPEPLRWVGYQAYTRFTGRSPRR